MKKLKKMAKGLIAGAALMGMVSSAGADVYNLNIYGASAQHKFWLNLSESFLLDAAGGECSDVVQDSYDKKHGIAKGTNCIGGNTIYIRYSSRASYDGVNAVNDGTPRDMVDETSCVTWAGPKNDSCTALKSVQPNLGASDVAWDAFTQSTSGYEDGNINYPAGPYSAPSATVVFPSSIRASIDEFNPIVVPFAFFANNSVGKFRCVRPEINVTAGVTNRDNWDPENPDAHKAYPHDMWECDPTKSDAEGHNPQCVGHYKCIDSLCNGGVNSGQACTTANDCPDVIEADTRCEAMPLNNINHAMAGLIFSGMINNWEDFGKYYTDGKIVRCMRHAGSGTHATVDDLLKPYALKNNSVAAPISFGPTWHYTSSSDLMKCVADFKGAIGYADADKLLDFKGIEDGCAEDAEGNPNNHLDDPDGVAGAHIMMYNGVEPTRQKIANCEYEFWAAQHVYYDTAEFTGTLATLRQRLEDYSSDRNNLTVGNLGNAAYFWASQAEMQCSKASATFTKSYIKK